MEIIVIRHGRVNYTWKKWSTSEQFNDDCQMYDTAPIFSISYCIPKDKFYRIYVSSLSRSKDTAYRIFGDTEYISSCLIDEVPLSASLNTHIKMPLFFWNITGRLQWWFNSSKQNEGRKETNLRAGKFVDMLIEKNENCIVVTHGFFMHSLVAVMKKKISKSRINLYITPMESVSLLKNKFRFVIEKEQGI